MRSYSLWLGAALLALAGLGAAARADDGPRVVPSTPGGQPAKPSVGEKGNLVGTWEGKATFKKGSDTITLDMRIVFEADGTYSLVATRGKVNDEQKGTYTYANGDLKMTMSGGDETTAYTITWKDKDNITSSGGGADGEYHRAKD
jgi:hypothetical protein